MKDGVLILFLSKYREQEERTYYVEGMETSYTGAQTNDAPVKYLMNYAAETGYVIQKILCVASKAVRNESESGNSTLQHFEDMLQSYIEEDSELQNIYNKEAQVPPRIIPIRYEEDIKDTEERAREVYRQIIENLQGESGFFVDYTGGFRDINFLMAGIVRYLEYQGISCQKIVYSNLENKTIQTLDCIYQMFQLINGVDQFVRTGNAKLLSECYKNETSKKTQELLDKIVEFAEVITLCDVKKIDAILPAISDALNNYNNHSAETEKNSFFVVMFQSLIDVIRDKLYLTENCQMTYPQLIRWCLDNNMIQQAITLYVEKMPKFYYDFGILKMPDKKVTVTMGETEEVAAFYRQLFDSLARGTELGAFADLISDLELASSIGGLRMNTIEKLKSKCDEDLLRRAVDNLIEFLKAHYYGGTGSRIGSDRSVKIYGEKIKNFPKTAEGFVNMLKTQIMWQHYFIFDNASDYRDMEGGTFQKKVRALDKLKKGRMPGAPPGLYDMMKYYCALKLLRNRINHASEAEEKEDERMAIARLETDHGVCMKANFQNIKDLMYKGLEAHKEK